MPVRPQGPLNLSELDKALRSPMVNAEMAKRTDTVIDYWKELSEETFADIKPRPHMIFGHEYTPGDYVKSIRKSAGVSKTGRVAYRAESDSPLAPLLEYGTEKMEPLALAEKTREHFR